MEKTFWHAIKANDYAVPEGHSLTDLTAELVGYLGATDPDLRIDIAWDILGQWIREQGRYTGPELAALRDAMLANLGHHIGEAGTDTVFRRTFAVWILTYIVQRDAAHPFLSRTDYTALVEALASYTHAEQDMRGWVEGKGWAHAAAHIGSLMRALATHPHAGAATHERLLMLVAALVTRLSDHVYVHGEDDRLVQAVYAIMQQDTLSLATWQRWLDRLAAVMEKASAGMPFDIRALHAYMNTRNFVRCLYFPLELCIPDQPPVWAALRPALLDTIKEVGLC